MIMFNLPRWQWNNRITCVVWFMLCFTASFMRRIWMKQWPLFHSIFLQVRWWKDKSSKRKVSHWYTCDLGFRRSTIAPCSKIEFMLVFHTCRLEQEQQQTSSTFLKERWPCFSMQAICRMHCAKCSNNLFCCI